MSTKAILVEKAAKKKRRPAKRRPGEHVLVVWVASGRERIENELKRLRLLTAVVIVASSWAVVGNREVAVWLLRVHANRRWKEGRRSIRTKISEAVK